MDKFSTYIEGLKLNCLRGREKGGGGGGGGVWNHKVIVKLDIQIQNREIRVHKNYIYAPSGWIKGLAISSVPSTGDTSITAVPLQTCSE